MATLPEITDNYASEHSLTVNAIPLEITGYTSWGMAPGNMGSQPAG